MANGRLLPFEKNMEEPSTGIDLESCSWPPEECPIFTFPLAPFLVSTTYDHQLSALFCPILMSKMLISICSGNKWREDATYFFLLAVHRMHGDEVMYQFVDM